MCVCLAGLAGSRVRQPGAACTGCDDRLAEDRLVSHIVVDLQPRRNVSKKVLESLRMFAGLF